MKELSGALYTFSASNQPSQTTQSHVTTGFTLHIYFLPFNFLLLFLPGLLVFISAAFFKQLRLWTQVLTLLTAFAGEDGEEVEHGYYYDEMVSTSSGVFTGGKLPFDLTRRKVGKISLWKLRTSVAFREPIPQLGSKAEPHLFVRFSTRPSWHMSMVYYCLRER